MGGVDIMKLQDFDFSMVELHNGIFFGETDFSNLEGVSQVFGRCGIALNCSGGGGMCGIGANCSGW